MDFWRFTLWGLQSCGSALYSSTVSGKRYGISQLIEGLYSEGLYFWGLESRATDLGSGVSYGNAAFPYGKRISALVLCLGRAPVWV